MAKISVLHKNIQSLNQEYQSKNDELKVQNNIVARLTKDLGTFRTKSKRNTTEEKLLSQQLDEAIKYQQNLKIELDAINIRLRDVMNEQLFGKLRTPQQLVTELSGSFPILFFPLRLETRFKTENGKEQLWVRVYPDDINVVKKENFISRLEYENLKVFWVEMLLANGNEELEKGAWKVLVNNHGTNRAAWLINHYKPIESSQPIQSDRDHTMVIINEDGHLKALDSYIEKFWIEYVSIGKIPQKHQELKEKIAKDNGIDLETFEEILAKHTPYNIDQLNIIDSRKLQIEILNLPDLNSLNLSEESWNAAPEATLLPDKFVAITYHKDTSKSHVFANAVRRTLHVGIDPDEIQHIQKNDSLDISLNKELAWMTDFEEAVQAGMATKIDLDAKEAIAGFDKLLVVGVRFSSDSKESKIALEDLFQTHAFSDEGFSFLKQGTPTNNTDESNSGYQPEEGIDESYSRIFKNTLASKSDCVRLAEALGISVQTFSSFSNNGLSDIFEAEAMNTALFPATLGYFMDEMLGDSFEDNDIKFTKTFFTKYVSGRGPLPAFRIGKQPYGILPTTVFSKLNVSEFKVLELHSEEVSFYEKLKSILDKLDDVWNTQLHKVSYVGKQGDSQQILLDVLGLHPTSVEFRQRFAEGMDSLYNLLALQSSSEDVPNTFYAHMLQESSLLMQNMGFTNLNVINPIFKKLFKPKTNILNGPLVDDVPASEITPIRSYTNDEKNYINWLINSAPEIVRTQNFGAGKVRPKAILYMLLRHSLMLAQSNSATNLLLSSKFLQNRKQVRDHDFIHVKGIKSSKNYDKFELLYASKNLIPQLKNKTLIDYLYERDIFNKSKETEDLREAVKALKSLENLPTARLERLMIEHLDCCNYRLDAWKTGLVQAKISQHIRQKEKEGIYLGAYGILLNLRPKNKAFNRHTIQRETIKGQKIVRETVLEDPDNLGYIHAPSMNQAVTAAVLRNAYDGFEDKTKPNPYAINLNSERVRLANQILEGLRNGQTLGALLGYQFERGLHDLYVSTGIEADKYIYPLRLIFPLVNNNIPETQAGESAIEKIIAQGESMETIEAHNVIDGLKLIQHYNQTAQKTYPFGLQKYNLPIANVDQAKAIQKEIERIININDAVADMITAETMYQAVQGNYERAAAITNAFSKGLYPPEIEFIKTPRTGYTITQKVALHFDHDNQTTYNNPRATIAPGVNKWLTQILPNPSDIVCMVEIIDKNKRIEELFVSQNDLGLEGIDLLFSANFDLEQAMTELDDRIIEFVRYKYLQPINLDIFSTIRIVYDIPNDKLVNNQMSFLAIASILKSLRHLFIGNKYLKPEDVSLQTTDNSIKAYYDTEELNKNVDHLHQILLQHKTLLSNLLQDSKGITQLSNSLIEELSNFDLPPAEINDIILQFESFLKDSFIFQNQSSIPVDLDAIFDSIFIKTQLNQSQINHIKNVIDTSCVEYKDSLTHIDRLMKSTITIFNTCALIDNNLTGTGFIGDAISHLYLQLEQKVTAYFGRWESKLNRFNEIISTIDASLSYEENVRLFQKAETEISTILTTPIPNTIAEYTNILNQKVALFSAKRDDVNSLFQQKCSSIYQFVQEIEDRFNNIADFDLLNFDEEYKTNIPVQLKKNLIHLHDNLMQAILNLNEYILGKLEKFERYQNVLNTINSNEELKDQLLEGFKILATPDVLIIPPLILSDDIVTDIKNAYTEKENILDFTKNNNNSLFPIDDWMAGLARVRKNIWEFENISNLALGYNPQNFIELDALQFPVKANNRWLAVQYKKQKSDPSYVIEEESPFDEIREDTLLYTVCNMNSSNTGNRLNGILIDSWTETIPLAEETTGVAFHYDQPNSEPPQTMLLMVSPEILTNWKWDNIIDGINETLQLAKQRAVEPSMLASTPFAQLFPTTMLAVSKNMMTVATNLATNISHVDPNP